MTTFVWNEILSVSVGEMSRTQAIECCRKFDALTEIFTNYIELMAETDILTVLEAPAVVKINGEVFSLGERTIELLDERPFKLVLPLTHDCFDALPMSLATAWINAALRSNAWFIDTLKKTMTLTTANNLEPKSDNAPSNGLNQMTSPMTMTGQ